MRRKIASVVVASLGAGLLCVASALPAKAANYDGSCSTSELCTFWGFGQVGSMADFDQTISNYTQYTFRTAGPGQGQNINDNVASVRNNSHLFAWWLFADANGGGGAPYVITPEWNQYDLGLATNKVSSHIKVLF